MSDIMRPIPYKALLNWVLSEYKAGGSIFGVSKMVSYDAEKTLPIFGGKTESPYGPAAGPNTQLAQNIVAAYLGGSRFFELKTVQKMDGRELAECVPKPCIKAEDECYNCEWSTELTVEEAYEEYVKAWFINKLLAKELGLGDPDGFVFNMSVGYDLAGIRLPKIDNYIEHMKNAEHTPIFMECMEESTAAVRRGAFLHVDEAFVKSISPKISNSITESTLHGCPPEEIESIATYLMKEKKLHTYIKCNPTLLGYDFARKTLDSLGFDYVAFDDHHFLEDLQWKDAVPMLHRLISLGKEEGVEFGVKLTNTFPVDVRAGELPSQEMYMSGRALFPLTIELAKRITDEFGGELRISYSGGADIFNIRELFESGIWPITMATTILKPGGYQRLSQIGEELKTCTYTAFSGVKKEKLDALVEKSVSSDRYRKPIKPLPSRKSEELLPLLDCYIAPCRSSCPISQDIPAYLRAMKEGRSEDAFRIILDRNALPFMTGTLCPHPCVDRCVRSHYEEGLHIREVKLMASEEAYDKVLPTLTGAEKRSDLKVAVVGGGPAGLSAASFLSRAGASVTIFEKQKEAGGVPKYVIPSFRISDETLKKDEELCLAYGASLVTGREITSVEELKKEGFTDIILAVGAWDKGVQTLQYGEALDALEFLEKVKEDPDSVEVDGDIIVIGGGNTAMDVARAAKRLKGDRTVRLVYRRTRRYMPADEEELIMAMDDGVEFNELLSPVGLKDGVLVCDVMALGKPDESGRRSPEKTGETAELPAALVITAVGERIDTRLFKECGAELDRKGRPVLNDKLQTTVDHVYAIGDSATGPSTIVEAVADAAKAAQAIAGCTYEGSVKENVAPEEDTARSMKGLLEKDITQMPDGRCLGCATVCEICTDVCPNRANLMIRVPSLPMPQILHVDYMCNECGNCGVFCPHTGDPYKDKLTLFATKEDFLNSTNQGFLVLNGTNVRLRLGTDDLVYDVADPFSGLYEPVRKMIETVLKDYSYLVF